MKHFCYNPISISDANNSQIIEWKKGLPKIRQPLVTNIRISIIY